MDWTQLKPVWSMTLSNVVSLHLARWSFTILSSLACASFVLELGREAMLERGRGWCWGVRMSWMVLFGWGGRDHARESMKRKAATRA